MDEARKAVLDKLIKRYSFKNITKHWNMDTKNLIELTSGYPSHGLGFMVYRKTWQPETFYKVKKVELFVTWPVYVIRVLEEAGYME